MTRPLRVGTRRSPLARAQTEWVIRRLHRAAPASSFEAVPLDASGDRDRSPGQSPDFTDRIDRALARGALDLAVHSAKDLPARLDRRLLLAAVPQRADPRDCLVLRDRRRPLALPRRARVGSSSPRRRAQLLRWRPDLTVVDVRGNVGTRIDFVRGGRLDAAVMAVAGLERLGCAEEIDRTLPITAFLPAPGQGALAVVVRAGDTSTARFVARIDDRRAHACLDAERSLADALGADCRLPLGGLATCRNKSLSLVGEVLSTDGRTSVRRRASGRLEEAREVGARLGDVLVCAGAAELLARRAA